MSTVATLLAQPVVRALGWTLLHFVWQGGLVAALYALVRAAVRRSDAGTRYTAACAALLLLVAAPVATFSILGSGPAAEPMAAGRVAAPAVASLDEPAATAVAPRGWQGVRATALASIDSALPWLVALWMVGVAALSLRFAGGWLLAERLRRRHTAPAEAVWQEALDALRARLRVSRSVRLCESALAEVPSVVGWLRPVILMPASAFVGLNERQVEAILAHELAHVRRHDYLVNLLQTAVETLLFYHPTVWWISRSIREEREYCCDDSAVAACGDVLTYARALAGLEELRASAPRLAVAATGGPLLRRIERLLVPPPATRRTSPYLASVVALAAIGGSWAGLQPTAHSGDTASAATRETAQEIEPLVPISEEGAGPAASGPRAASKGISADRSRSRGTAESQSTAEDARSSDATVESDERPEADVDPIDGPTADPDDFAAAMAALGYRSLTTGELAELRTNGVTPYFVRELQSLGYSNLPVRSLVAMSIHGVTPEYVRELEGMGYDRLSADELSAITIHGVTSDLVRALVAAGLTSLSSDDLTGCAIHGVTADFVRGLRALGYTGLSAADLQSMTTHGVTLRFVREFRSLGYSSLSVDELVEMTIHGVTVELARSFKSRGLTPSVRQLIDMAIHGVTTDLDLERSAAAGRTTTT